MLERKFRLVVAATALALAAVGAGGGAAAASTAAPAHAAISTPAAALSDTINFTGVAVPAATNGTYTLNTTDASVLTAGSPIRYPAKKYMWFSLQTLAGSSRTTSAVGVQVFNFKLVRSSTGNSTVNLVDAGGSYEINNDGSVVPATGSGAVSVTPITGTPNLKIAGTVNIFK